MPTRGGGGCRVRLVRGDPPWLRGRGPRDRDRLAARRIIAQQTWRRRRGTTVGTRSVSTMPRQPSRWSPGSSSGSANNAAGFMNLWSSIKPSEVVADGSRDTTSVVERVRMTSQGKVRVEESFAPLVKDSNQDFQSEVPCFMISRMLSLFCQTNELVYLIC